MQTDTLPTELTPGQRVNEIAAFLATGLIRLQHKPQSAHYSVPENFSESSTSGLAIRPDLRLTVSHD